MEGQTAAAMAQEKVDQAAALLPKAEHQLKPGVAQEEEGWFYID